jgi:hypothetical protein
LGTGRKDGISLFSPTLVGIITEAYFPLDILKEAGYHRFKVAKSSGQE